MRNAAERGLSVRIAVTLGLLLAFGVTNAQDLEPRTCSIAPAGTSFDSLGVAWQYRWGAGLVP